MPFSCFCRRRKVSSRPGQTANQTSTKPELQTESPIVKDTVGDDYISNPLKLEIHESSDTLTPSGRHGVCQEIDEVVTPETSADARSVLLQVDCSVELDSHHDIESICLDRTLEQEEDPCDVSQHSGEGFHPAIMPMLVELRNGPYSDFEVGQSRFPDEIDTGRVDAVIDSRLLDVIPVDEICEHVPDIVDSGISEESTPPIYEPTLVSPEDELRDEEVVVVPSIVKEDPITREPTDDLIDDIAPSDQENTSVHNRWDVNEPQYIDEFGSNPEDQYNTAASVPFFNGCSATLGYSSARLLQYRLSGIVSLSSKRS